MAKTGKGWWVAGLVLLIWGMWIPPVGAYSIYFDAGLAFNPPENFSSYATSGSPFIIATWENDFGFNHEYNNLPGFKQSGITFAVQVSQPTLFSIIGTWGFTFTLDNRGANPLSYVDLSISSGQTLWSQHYDLTPQSLISLIDISSPDHCLLGQTVIDPATGLVYVGFETSLTFGYNEVPQVPLPSALLLCASGLLGLAGWRRLRKV